MKNRDEEGRGREAKMGQMRGKKGEGRVRWKIKRNRKRMESGRMGEIRKEGKMIKNRGKDKIRGRY